MGFVYQWLNSINLKVYIGSTKQKGNGRKNDHLSELKRNIHCNKHLQNAFNLMPEAFSFQILEYCNDELLLERETYFLSLYVKNNEVDHLRCYNIEPTPNRTIMSVETRNKLSEVHKGKKYRLGKTLNEETKKILSELGKNRIFSEETKLKLSKSNKGRTHTEEARKNMRQGKIGKKHTEETKLKMSQAKKGKKLSKEQKIKISEACKGNQNCLGYKHTEETKNKMSKSQSIRHIKENNE